MTGNVNGWELNRCLCILTLICRHAECSTCILESYRGRSAYIVLYLHALKLTSIDVWQHFHKPKPHCSWFNVL